MLKPTQIEKQDKYDARCDGCVYTVPSLSAEEYNRVVNCIDNPSEYKPEEIAKLLELTTEQLEKAEAFIVNLSNWKERLTKVWRRWLHVIQTKDTAQ